MAKLYIFGIGGTGARVIKALTFLLATGVKINADQVIPIIIDPDQANGDVERTVNILREYQAIHSKLDFGSNHKNQFFKTPIKDITNQFRLELHDVENKKFKHFIGYDSLDANNKALASMLFSTKNLDADMQVGFKGNPNIGSVVLNQFKDSQDYKNFTADFAQDDRIFIVSSIFGGTGASGFPLLVKNLREPEDKQSATDLLRNALIGAVTVLPYFGVKPDDNSAIDKATFISKTKAALTYYKDNLSGNKSLNALYYIADVILKDQDNNEGSSGQRNEAHFVELASALAIINFMEISDMKTEGGKTVNPIYKEYGLKEETTSISFKDLGPLTNGQIEKPLIQYSLFTLYLKNNIDQGLSQAWAKGGIKYDNSFKTSTFYSSNLAGFNNHFEQWFCEMKDNSVSFSPINLGVEKTDLFELVNGAKPKIGWLEKGKNYARIDHHLNSVESGIVNSNPEQKFMNMFYMATEKVVEEKF